jgi:pSer/pThr/pTyr-binding forkhead associated (FHA) protein
MHKAQVEIISSSSQSPPEGFLVPNVPVTFVSDAVFGRELSEVQFAIDDGYVSRRHFQIAFVGGEFFLTDLESRHGTFLNDERIRQSVRLKSGDSIRVGKTTLAFKTDAPKFVPNPNPALASYDQPAVMSMDSNSAFDMRSSSRDMLLPDHPTDLEIPIPVEPSLPLPIHAEVRPNEVKKKASPLPTAKPNNKPNTAANSGESKKRVSSLSQQANAPVDDSGLEVIRPDSHPQFQLDLNDFSLAPAILSDESVQEVVSNGGDSDSDGPVFLDDFEIDEPPQENMPATKSPSPETKPSQAIGEQLHHASDIDVFDDEYSDAVEPRDVSANVLWQECTNSWQRCNWRVPASGSELLQAVEEYGRSIPLWAIVHFGKAGSTTPWGLECYPIWRGVPEAIARLYGPVLIDSASLRKALKAESIFKLWKADALLWVGDADSATLQQKVREGSWLKGATESKSHSEFPIWSSCFWELWTTRPEGDSAVSKPSWESLFTSVVLPTPEGSGGIRCYCQDHRRRPELTR